MRSAPLPSVGVGAIEALRERPAAAATATATAEAAASSATRDVMLDAWRGVSVLLVIFDHAFCSRLAWGRTVGEMSQTAARSWQAIQFWEFVGQLGVQLFFAISGYIITSLLLREHRRNGVVSLPAFYVRRAFRILPPLWLMLAFIVVMKTAGIIAPHPKSIALGATFLCDLRFMDCGWFTAHTWSLSVEEQFYLVWPLALVLLRFRAVPQAALAAAAACMILQQLIPPQEYAPDICLSFACIALGCLYAASDRFRALIARAASPPLILLAAVVLLSQGVVPIVLRGQYRLQNLVHPLLVVFLLFSSLRYRELFERRWLVRALAGVGLVSYGLYIWHPAFIAPSMLLPHRSMLDYAPLFLAVTLLSYRFIEQPLIRYGGGLSRALIAKKLGRARPQTP
jgi:peptidoglycan/LPS O-acetylase OafA/YrhL